MSKQNFNEFVKKNLDLVGALDGFKAYTGPKIVQIDLTNNCNLNCVGCWCHSDLLGNLKLKGEEKKRKLPYEIVKKLIEDLHEMGIKEIMLSGSGEPFMYPKIMDVMRLIKKKRMKCQIITNFTLVNEKIIRELVDLKVDNITVSLWAGTHETYVKTHPNQTEETFHRIKRMLQYLHSIKKEDNLPHVKIFNVISNRNYYEIEDMLDFALDSLVDYLEFQVIDVVKGKTNSLALSEKERESIIKQLNGLSKRKDYLEVPMSKSLEILDKKMHKMEFAEFGRFVKVKSLVNGFNYFLEDITCYRVKCPKGKFHINVIEDNIVESALKFVYLKKVCKKCDYHDRCNIDKGRYLVKAEFLSLIGFGSFYRRVSNESVSQGVYDSSVDPIPCYVGWIYARILTDGSVIPCCKAHLFPLGNLYKNSFKDIWFSKKYNEFREKAKKLKKSNPYFKRIECYKECDNLGMNLELHKRIKDLSFFQKKRILFEIKK